MGETRRKFDVLPRPPRPSAVRPAVAALALEGTEQVLEVGTGYRYQTALLARLAAHVVSIELWPDLAAQARATTSRASSGSTGAMASRSPRRDDSKFLRRPARARGNCVMRARGTIGSTGLSRLAVVWVARPGSRVTGTEAGHAIYRPPGRGAASCP
jgi:Protein-L-isoaspartate(D-aspartate) O-methyltransferase (PCMT)